MRQPLVKLLPVLLTAGVILALWLFRGLLGLAPGIDFIARFEWFTYDWRARLALRRPAPVAENLGVIYIDEESLEQLNQRLGRFRWPWPRSVYGRVIRELKAQDAKVVGIDGFFFELGDAAPAGESGSLTPDEFFGQQLAAAGNVVLITALQGGDARHIELHAVPNLFRTNAWRLAQDGLRALSRNNADRLRSVTAYVEDARTGKRLWQLGFQMAARALDLDLDRAVIRPGRIVLPSRSGPPLVVPVDRGQQVYIDWSIVPGRYAEVVEGPFHRYYEDALRRERGEPVNEVFKDRLVLVGFAASGGHASDWGPTPISEQTPLFLAHLNVANSLLTGRFITRAGPWTENLLIALMALVSAGLGWRLRVGWGMVAFVLVFALYLAVAVWLSLAYRYWLPVAAPLGGAFVMGYVCLLSFRMVVERLERRRAQNRIRSAFKKMVSPNVFNLLLQQPWAALGSTHRDVTIYFADVRGFTHFLEERHARTLARVQEHSLAGHAADALIGREVQESLETVNFYLGQIADLVKEHDGTLDKYIGDCVMAFWGAPVQDERHAVEAVHAAVAVHRALHARNQERLAENDRRAQENLLRQARGQPPLDPLPILHVGSALNSGPTTVGFMGSAAHVSNYTVFGREVNIASRLEGLAEADRILVTEATFAEVRRFEPDFAATFLKFGRVELAGIAEPVQVYMVPWQ